VIAGYHNGWLSSAEIYDPVTGGGVSRNPFSHTALNILPHCSRTGVFWSWQGAHDQGVLLRRNDRVEIFDPKTNRWQKAALHENTTGVILPYS